MSWFFTILSLRGRLNLGNKKTVSHLSELIQLQPLGLKTNETSNNKNNAGSKTRKRTQKRTTLIPQSVDYEIIWKAKQGKIKRVWQELEFNLNFSRHELSIPVMFRVLIELSTQNYLERNRLSRKKTLNGNILIAGQKLEEQGHLTKNEISDLKRVANNNHSLRDIEALHRVVHSSSVSLSRDDLIALWDAFEPYIVACIKS